MELIRLQKMTNTNNLNNAQIVIGYFCSMFKSMCETVSFKDGIERLLREFVVNEIEDDAEAEYLDKDVLTLNIIERFKEELDSMHINNIIKDEISKYDFDANRTYYTFDVRFNDLTFTSKELKQLEGCNEYYKWEDDNVTKQFVTQALDLIKDEQMFDTKIADMPIRNVSFVKLDDVSIAVHYDKHCSIYIGLDEIIGTDSFKVDVTIKVPSCYLYLDWNAKTYSDERIKLLKLLWERWDDVDVKIKDFILELLNTNKALKDRNKDKIIDSVKISRKNKIDIIIEVNYRAFFKAEISLKPRRDDGYHNGNEYLLEVSVLCLNKSKLKELRGWELSEL